jgi:hypothetical protein
MGQTFRYLYQLHVSQGVFVNRFQKRTNISYENKDPSEVGPQPCAGEAVKIPEKYGADAVFTRSFAVS